jgi:hypothetical protein
MDFKQSELRPLWTDEEHGLSRIACSCFVDRPQKPNGLDAHDDKSQAVSINNINAHGICFEAFSRAEEGLLLNIKLNPLEGPSFNAGIRVLHTWPSHRRGFYLTVASFEELTETDRQSLLSLLGTIRRMQEKPTE